MTQTVCEYDRYNTLTISPGPIHEVPGLILTEEFFKDWFGEVSDLLLARRPEDKKNYKWLLVLLVLVRLVVLLFLSFFFFFYTKFVIPGHKTFFFLK